MSLKTLQTLTTLMTLPLTLQPTKSRRLGPGLTGGAQTTPLRRCYNISPVVPTARASVLSPDSQRVGRHTRSASLLLCIYPISPLAATDIKEQRGGLTVSTPHYCYESYYYFFESCSLRAARASMSPRVVFSTGVETTGSDSLRGARLGADFLDSARSALASSSKIRL